MACIPQSCGCQRQAPSYHRTHALTHTPIHSTHRAFRRLAGRAAGATTDAMDGRAAGGTGGHGHYPMQPPPTTSSLGVSYPSSGALNEAAAMAAAAAAGEKGGFAPLRRSFSLSAIGQGGAP